MENPEADTTRALLVVRRRKSGSIRYAHSGVVPAGEPGKEHGRSSGGGASSGGTVGRDAVAAAVDAVAAAVDEAADDRTRALPVMSAARAGGAERVRLTERVRRAGTVRLAERIRLRGRGGPPEIAHE